MCINVINNNCPKYIIYKYLSVNFIQGIPGYIEGENSFFSDALKFVDLIEAIYPGKKIFLEGMSLGGTTLFELNLLCPGRFSGSIMLCPAIKN